MSSNGNQVPLAPSQRGPGPYPRAPTPHRAECYHPTGATGGAYMPNSAGGAQSSAQAALRVQPTPQPSAPPAPQQDMSKTTMAGHSYVSPQNQTPQSRPQYSNYQYRAAQHGTRPNTHPRQQQQFIPGATATPTAPVMYHPLVFPPHMVPQSYPQPRSTQGYFPFMGPTSYMTYSTPASHTPSYYYASNSQQLPTANLQANTPGARSNPTTLVGPQASSATPTAPAATLPHPQVQTHMHQAMPSGIRPPPNKRSHRVPIIDPVTQQDILSDLYSNDGQYLSNDSSERQTPQPESTPAAHRIVEEFNRMVSEAAKQPTASESAIASNYVSKNVDSTLPATAGPVPTQSDAMISNNNNTTKSEIVTVIENKSLGSDVAPELNETPVVSAISDSPVIVPKMPINIKQLQKNSDVQPLVLDNNKNVPPNKQHKHNKNKPVVPQVEELEKATDCVSSTVQEGGQQSVPVTTPTAAVTTPPAPTPVPVAAFSQAPAPALITGSHPQPQRIREPRDRTKTDDKEKDKNQEKDTQQEKETSPAPNNSKGPAPVVISPVNIIPEIVNSSSSQSSQVPSVESTKKQVATKQLSPTGENESPVFESKVEPVTKSEPTTLVPTVIPSATELLSASIEKVAKEKELPTVLVTISESKEASSAIQAQVKLNQSIASCIRSNQPESKMKDINLNNKTLDPDTANGNSDTTKIEITTEDINKNEKVVTSSKKGHKKSGSKTNTEDNMRESDSYENGKDETDKVITAEDETALPTNDDAAKAASPEKSEAPPVFVPKYKYSEDQWSPLNQTGKRCYDIGLLKQIKEDPLSKNKPNVPLLESCNVMRSTPILETVSFSSISRPHTTESFLPPFAKAGLSTRSNVPRDVKKMTTNSKGSVKLLAPSNNSPHKSKIIHVSLSLREDIKLNETENAWKPSRYKKGTVSEEEQKSQELYKQFRGILNKLTPQKFDTLMDKVKSLEINNQERLEGVIDLVFEKAIDEPNFSEAYAAMCNKLSMLKVPVDNPTTPDKCVNFRGLIISKCQNQFVTDKVDEQVLKIEKDIAECTDPLKKRELQLQLEEENRRVRMRSVGNVRFIGELYKLKMLTSKIMVYCMNYLIDKLEEEKLECLCKLLTTIGEQVESEVREQLDNVFKKMQDIVDRKSNKISSRVRFMIQDVIELRKRRWVIKSVVDSQPKMMDQIQKEADQQQRQIEIMNSSPMGGFRRDDGGRGKRGDGRRQNPTPFMDNSNTWKPTGNWKSVDTSKLSKGVMQKSLTNIKLAPQMSGWNHGSGTKIATAQTGNNSIMSLAKTNKYSVLENVQTDPSSLRGSKDITPSYPKGASIERSTFNSRGDFSSGSGSRSGSMGVARSNSSSRSTSSAPQAPPAPVEAPAPPLAPVPQEPLPEEKKKSVKSTIDLSLFNPDDNEMVGEVKHLFPPQYHAALVTEILNVALEKSPKEVGMIAKSLLHLVSTNTISPDNFVSGLNETFEFAPDLYIDIPMLYEYLGNFVAPQIEKKHITFGQVLKLSGNIISENHGHLLLKAVINNLKDSMGPSFVKSKWQESGLQLKDWMKEDQVAKWIEDNKFEFLEGNTNTSEETKKLLTPAETQSKLLQLMNSDENCECIRGWVQDNLGKASNEDWFMRALFQAICEHSLFGPEGRDVPHFNQDRMNKYYGLINDFGELRPAREASCLFGIQQLIHRLEHPQGLTLEIFQYLHEQYIISVDGFIAWEESEMEPEGKGVMMKALTSFFTNIKEADNEDSCSEE